MARVAVLGTGLLGAGFALNLIDKGHDVIVWNRTASKTDALVAAGAMAALTPADAVRGVERAHLVLTSDDAVDSVIEQALPGLDGAWVIDHSTNAPARVAERAPRLRAAGVRYVPAPVFMAPANSRNATGLMLLAASDDEAAELTPILETMTGKVWHVGERADLAAVYKISGNAVLLSVSGIMGDLLAIGQAQGLDPDQVFALFDAFQLGPFFPRAGQRVVSAPTMPASFELTMARKDVGLMIGAARSPDDLVVLPAIAAAMDRGIAAGKGDKDFAIMAWPGRDDG